MTSIKRIGHGVLALVLGASMFGCATRIGDFTVGSSKNISLLSQKGEKVEGEDCSTSILFFIPIAGPMIPNFKTAVDRALERAKGDVVADAVMWESKILTGFFNQHCYKVEGKVARAELGKR